jgi:hypothetical protein
LPVLIVTGLVIAGALFALHAAASAVNQAAGFLHHFRYVWRFLSGHTHNGQYHTNATWTRRADKVLHPTGRAHRWHWLPRGVRALIRTGSVLLALVIGAGLITETLLTVVLLSVAAAAAGGYAGWRAWVRAAEWRHHRTWVRPLHRSLTPVLGAPPPRLAIERDRSRVVLELPEAFIGEDRVREGIIRAVETKLALEAPDHSWHLDGKKPQVVFTRSEPPPSMLRWPDIQRLVAAAGPGQLLCGLGKKNAEVFVSTSLDSPHFGVAMGTGGGKSNTAAFWLVQELRRGACALILDAKWFSHPWTFKDMDAGYGQLPNVAYARTTADLHNAMVWLGVELQRRTETAERLVNARGDVLGDVGPTLWIVAEELNLATPRLKQYWAAVRGKDDPKRSPALDGMAAVSFAGRAVDMHLIVIGQMLTASALGGGDVRENIGVRMLSRYTANSWKMQTDLPMPPPSDVPGRVQVIASGTAREAQVPLMDMGQCRELAVDGTVTRCPDDMPGIAGVARVPLPASPSNASEQGFVLGHGSPPGRPPGTLTLREATREGLFVSLDAARKAVRRRELEAAGRDGNAHLYYIADLAQTIRSTP